MEYLTEKVTVDLNIQSETFLSYVDVAEASLITYSKGIAYFLEYLKRNNINQPTRSDFRAFRDNKNGELATNTVNSYLTPIRVFFRYLAENKIYPDITENVKSVKISTIPKKQTLSIQEVKEIVNGLTDERDKALIPLMITTGLRAYELANAKIENIRKYNDEIVLFFKGKGHADEDRYVKLDSYVLSNILNYIGNRENGNIFVSESNRNTHNTITEKSIRRIVKRILGDYGINEDTFSCHSFRRSFATILYQETKDILAVKEVLGHKSIATTQRYVAQCIRDNDRAEYTVSSLIFGG